MSDINEASSVSTVNFLPDQPSDVDYFGSHGRVANAVAEVIRTANTVNVIGLLGSWGSGKSTVIKQIEKLLSDRGEDQNLLTFNYDAWLHQNDPPRRAFLEALISELSSRGMLPDEKWQDRIDDLSGKTEETETETTRSISETGKWIFLSLGIVPLGLGLLNFEVIQKAFADSPDWLAQITFALSLIFTTAPLAVITLFYLKWRPWAATWQTLGIKGFAKFAFWTNHKPEFEGQSILALLTNQSHERTVNKTKITQDPTAIEFRDVFRDLLKAIGGKRLIIVIDNLDRLPETDAMQLWATIRSLFLGNEIAPDLTDQSSKPTIVLPIDEGAIERMFALSHPEQCRELASSFMDKTFDITFYINEPIMSDWRRYFETQLQTAFGSAATADRVYWTTKIFEQKLVTASGVRKTTPRKLIKLVNSIGAIAQQWPAEQIEFVSMAFYVIHRSSIRDDINQFLKGGWDTMDAAVPDWKKQIVALHFGVEPEKAFQTLLSEPLRLAIIGNDKEKFDELLSNEGSHAVLEDVIGAPPSHKSFAGWQPEFLANASLLIAPTAEKNEIWALQSMSALTTLWLNSSLLESYRSDFARVVAALAPFARDNIAQLLSVSVEKLGSSFPSTAAKTDTIESFAGCIAELVKLSSKYSTQMPVIEIETDYQSLFALVKILPFNLLPFLKIEQASAEVVAKLTADLETEDACGRVPAVLRNLAAAGTIQFKDRAKLNWDGIADRALQIAQGNDISYPAVGPAIDVLGLLHSKSTHARTLVAQFFDQGQIFNRLNEADNQKLSDELADVTALMLLKGSDFAGPNGKAWQQVIDDDNGFIENVRTALLWYTWSNPTIFAHKALKTRPSLQPVIRELLRYEVSKHNSTGISSEYLFGNFDDFVKNLGDDLVEKLLSDMSERPDFWSGLESVNIGPSYDAAISSLAAISNFDRNKLIEAVLNRLKGVELENWRTAIQDGGAPYGLVDILNSNLNQISELGDELTNALTESLNSLAHADEDMRQRWILFSKFVSKGSRTTLFKNLRDIILSGQDFANLSGFFGLAGFELLELGKFSEEADKTARHIVLPLLGQTEGIDFLGEHSTYFSKIVSMCDAETKSTIDEKFRAMNDEQDGIDRSKLDAIRLAATLE